MFDKKIFAEILNKMYKTYNNQRDFSSAIGVNRTYISQYMNMKLNDPPKPEILKRMANNSNGIISYAQLMEVCGYLDAPNSIGTNSRLEYITKNTKYLQSIGLTPQQIKELSNIVKMDISSTEYIRSLDAFLNSLSFELAYIVLIFLQSMLTYSQETLNDRITIAKELKSETDKWLEKIRKDKSNLITKKNSKLFNCPVYGCIAAGQPNWAEECLEGYLPIDPNLMNIAEPEECFFLRVNGESMNKIIKNGAYALIRKQDIVEDGEIAVVLVNGFDATLKRFTRQNDLIILEPMSNDPSFTTQVYAKDTEIKILGKYIGKFEINK